MESVLTSERKESSQKKKRKVVFQGEQIRIQTTKGRKHFKKLK